MYTNGSACAKPTARQVAKLSLKEVVRRGSRIQPQMDADLRRWRGVTPKSWSVPRLRGRSDQSEIAKQVFALSVLFGFRPEHSPLFGKNPDSVMSSHERIRSSPQHYRAQIAQGPYSTISPCSPLPRKRGTLHNRHSQYTYLRKSAVEVLVPRGSEATHGRE